jgi:hypothetical protein
MTDTKSTAGPTDLSSPKLGKVLACYLQRLPSQLITGYLLV